MIPKLLNGCGSLGALQGEASKRLDQLGGKMKASAQQHAAEELRSSQAHGKLSDLRFRMSSALQRGADAVLASASEQIKAGAAAGLPDHLSEVLAANENEVLAASGGGVWEDMEAMLAQKLQELTSSIMTAASAAGRSPAAAAATPPQAPAAGAEGGAAAAAVAPSTASTAGQLEGQLAATLSEVSRRRSWGSNPRSMQSMH